MLKWLGVGCLVVGLIAGALMWVAYRQVTTMAERGPTVSVGVAATPDRVFASLANADSLSSWFMSGTTLRVARKGYLVAGDSIFINAARGDTVPTAWVIDTVVPNQLVVSHWARTDGLVLQRRRDSLAVRGDSTIIVSTVHSTMTDSIASARSRSGGGVSGGLLDMTATLGAGAARMQTEQDLRRLKGRIEGPRAMRP